MILVFGNINVNILTNTHTSLMVGNQNNASHDSMLDISGNSAVHAISAARGGAKVSLIGTIGNDVFGKHCLETLRREGINTSGIAKSKTNTGMEISISSPNHEVTTIVSRGANRHSHAGQIPEIHLNERSLLLLSDDIDEKTLSTLLKRSKDKNAHSVLCLRHNQSIGADILSLADIIITDEKMKNNVENQAQNKGCSIVITKEFGISGASAISKRGDKHHYYAPETSHTDISGCFDVFGGFFAACLQAGLPLERAITLASKASHATAQKTGIYPSIPYLGHVDDIYKMDDNDIKTRSY